MLNNETVFTLKDKSAKEIKAWLSHVIETEEGYKEKLKEFNILLLAECINSNIFSNKDREWMLSWSQLYIFVLSLLSGIYDSNTDSYLCQEMRFRVAMIKRLGLDPKTDVLDLDHISKWIDADDIRLEKIEKLKEVFKKKEDKESLYLFMKVKCRISILKELVDCDLLKTDQRIDKLFKFIKGIS